MTDHQRHSKSIAFTLGLAISLLNALPSLAQAAPQDPSQASPKVPAPAAEVGGTTTNPPPPPNNGWVWLLLLPLGGGITWWALQKREPSHSSDTTDRLPNQTLPNATEPIETVPSSNQTIAQNTNAIPNSIFPESLEPSVNLNESNDLTQSNVEAAKYDLGYHSETSELAYNPNLNQTNDLTQSAVEASKYNLGYTIPSVTDPSAHISSKPPEFTADDSPKIVFMAHNTQSAYLNWDIPNQARQDLRDRGGQQLALRLYDATDIDLNYHRPHSVQQYGVDETSREYYMPIPMGNRDYVAEIGYITTQGEWLSLARSNPLRIAPIESSNGMKNNPSLHERMFWLSWPTAGHLGSSQATSHLGSSQYHEASPKIIPQDDWF